MPRYWTCHWQFKYWNPDHNSEGEPVCGSGSNMFRKRGVAKGDIVYIVSLSDGQLYLGGRMVVKDILSRRQAVKLWGDGLYDNSEWVADPEKEGTLLNLHRRLSPAITKQLRFTSKDGPREPFFVSDTHLDNQATRGLRELTPASATLLDRIIDGTDHIPVSNDLITVTELLPDRVNVQSLANGYGKVIFSKQCVYTIKHSNDLVTAVNGGGLATFTECKKWTSAEHLLEQAKRDGERLPILFAPAEDTRSLLAWGVLDEIEAGETTIYSCSGLQFFNPRPKKTTLRLHSNNKPLAVGFIRPYAICITPHKLLQQLVPNTDCSTYLLTWNPELWNGELASNKSVEWSCGNSKRIRTGDRLFLMRQGSEPRGICASGVAMSDVISDQDGRSVEMHIEAFRNPETESILGRTALDELNRNTDHPMNWSIQISGTQIPPEVAQRLEIAWAKLCSDGPTPQPRIRFIDPELLRKIEEAAVSLVTSDLKGWSIRTREHEANLGFDLECSRGSEVMHLEVKGTTDSYPCFNLQASQYKAASNDKHWRIAVVTNALHPEIAKVTYFDGDTFLRSFAIDPTQYRARLKDDANT